MPGLGCMDWQEDLASIRVQGAECVVGSVLYALLAWYSCQDINKLIRTEVDAGLADSRR